MLNKKLLELLNYLQIRDNWVNSSELSSKLNVSLRSVKNYISEIKRTDSNLIISSRNGYKANKYEVQIFLKNLNSLIPETPQERINYIIIKLIRTNKEFVDIYDLSTEICVSESTLKADLYKTKSKCYEFDLTLNISGNNISLEGLEKNKRKLMSSILYNKLDEKPMNIGIVQEAFADYDIHQINEIVVNVFKKYHCFINDYSLVNLVLHITITIDRIKNNYISEHVSKNSRLIIKQHEYEIACEIAKELKTAYDISYNENEIYELSLLIVSSGVTNLNFRSIDRLDLNQLVGKETMELVKDLVEYISDYYYIEFNESEFLVRFALHIKNLITRCKINHYSKNPLTDSIKSNCPLIYDCAANISLKIKNFIHCSINEDEIAYIALHIGCALENQKKLQTQITCCILFPQYYDLDIKLAESISSAFRDSLLIKYIATNEKELEKMQVDFIISTIQFENHTNLPFVIINPFFIEKDRKLIASKIDELRNNKQKLKLSEDLCSIFNKSLFLKDKDFKDEKETIEFMCNQMESQGYVTSDFKKQVLEREAMSSTAFNGIAIPHSMHMNAIKTGMFTIINQHPMKWGKQQVNIIFLLTINKNEKKIFYDMFDSLTTILSNEANLKKLIHCNSFEEFIDTILKYM